MDGLRVLAHGNAVAAALLDGAVVGGWLGTRELDDRPSVRRRLRVSLLAGYTAGTLLGDLVWQRAAHPDPETVAESDLRAMLQALALATAASAALSTVDRRVPRVLAARGVEHPHRAFGLAVGVAYAGCAYAVWHAQARRRIAALDGAAAQERDAYARRRASWRRLPKRGRPDAG